MRAAVEEEMTQHEPQVCITLSQLANLLTYLETAEKKPITAERLEKLLAGNDYEMESQDQART